MHRTAHTHVSKWFVARNESTSHAIVIVLTNIIISVIPIPTISSSGNRTTLERNIIKTKCNSTSKTKTDNVHGESASMENVAQLCTECNPIYFKCDLIGLIFLCEIILWKIAIRLNQVQDRKSLFKIECRRLVWNEIVPNWFRSVHKESWHKKKNASRISLRQMIINVGYGAAFMARKFQFQYMGRAQQKAETINLLNYTN